MKNIAVFPGSFDPITKGHESVVLRAINIFDEIIISIGENSQKRTMFSLEQRKKWLEETFANHSNIKVDTYSGLTVDYCRKVNAKYIIRGLRNSVDYQYERNIALINNDLFPEIETIFLLTKPEHSSCNSSFVREILTFGGDITKFIPNAIQISEKHIQQ